MLGRATTTGPPSATTLQHSPPVPLQRSQDAGGASVLLDLGRGVAPGPPAPGRRGHWPQGVQDIAGPVLLDGQAGCAALPGQGPHDLSILWAEVSVGFQPALAALLVLAQ
jgi:hypothetical protein